MSPHASAADNGPGARGKRTASDETGHRGDSPRRTAPSPRKSPLRWAGTRAFLIECSALDEVMRWHAHLTAHPYPGQLDVLAAAETVLLTFSSHAAARKAANDVVTARLDHADTASGKTVEIDVIYDGEDLAEVGELTGLGERGVIEAHTGAEWTAAFGGFAPGFAYLVASEDPLDVPRRDSPRTAVPAGSVALAGRFSAVYPQRSPGGWQLIGRTNERLWDVNREEPALIRPGDTVTYRAVRELVEVAPDSPARNESETDKNLSRALVIEEPGMQALLQDGGRPGLGDLGVVASGAADRASAEQANRLVGNPPDTAVIETVLGGLSVTARGHHAVALSGAPCPLRVEGPDGSRPVAFHTPFALYDGERLTLDAPPAGLRSYLAVRGGFTGAEVLGSRSTDVMSGIGPEPLQAGAELPVGTVPPGRAVGPAEAPAVSFPDQGEPATLRVTPGPRDDWFTPETLENLTGQEWAVSNQSNRVGVRFVEPDKDAVLERSRDGELASEGVVAGSLQVPHSGIPVLFLADHPVTGGYPVIGVVVPEDLPLAAQLPPGAAVRFALVDGEDPPPENSDTEPAHPEPPEPEHADPTPSAPTPSAADQPGESA